MDLGQGYYLRLQKMVISPVFLLVLFSDKQLVGRLADGSASALAISPISAG
jgi:hypothetical protein